MSSIFVIIGRGSHVDIIQDTLDQIKECTYYINFDYEEITLNELVKYRDDKWFVAIGNNLLRQKVVEHIKQLWKQHQMEGNMTWATIIHPCVGYISPKASIDEGSYIGPCVVIQIGSVVGKHCIINTGATCDHHNQIGDYAHVAPGCHLCGHVSVRAGCCVGAGTTAVPNVNIGINTHAHSCLT